MRAIQDANGMTVYIDNEEDRITFQNADNDTVIWDEGEVPVLKRDVENVIIPRELYLRERADLRAERLIEELYKEPSNALETKLDIIMKSVRDRAGEGGISAASYNRQKDELHVEYVNGTVESIQIEPPERQLQNMVQGREPLAARAAEQTERTEPQMLPDTFTVEVMIIHVHLQAITPSRVVSSGIPHMNSSLSSSSSAMRCSKRKDWRENGVKNWQKNRQM